MSLLLNRIKNDRNKIRLENARREKLSKNLSDEHMIASLTTLYSDAQRVGFDDGKRESTDSEVIAVVKKHIKGLEERLSYQYDELIHTELCYLMGYVPTQLTEYEMKQIAAGYISENPDAKMGQIMGYFKQNHNGLYDGKLLSQVVKGVL